MVLTVNGQKKEIGGDLTVSGLLDELSIDPETVVVERNMNILKREDHGEEVLEDGDSIEIIQMVDGG
jgi:thiamine biosynthesis protein ThiS